MSWSDAPGETCESCGAELAEGARYCTGCGQLVVPRPPAPEPAVPEPSAPEPAAPSTAENPWVPAGALDADAPVPTRVGSDSHDRTAVTAPVKGAQAPRAQRWHPVGGALAVLAGAAVIAGTFLGLFSLSVNGVRSPTVTVWRAHDTMAVPVVVEHPVDGRRRGKVSSDQTRQERVRARSAPLFSLDPTPGQDRWILLAAGVIAVVVGSTAIIRSRLIWRLILLLDGVLVGVVAARYFVAVSRNVIAHYRGPPDLTLNLAFRTNVGLGAVLLFAAAAVLVIAAVFSAFRRPAGMLGG